MRPPSNLRPLTCRHLDCKESPSGVHMSHSHVLAHLYGVRMQDRIERSVWCLQLVAPSRSPAVQTRPKPTQRGLEPREHPVDGEHGEHDSQGLALLRVAGCSHHGHRGGDPGMTPALESC